MNAEQLRGKWLQLKGAAKQQWAKLTEDDMEYIDGSLYRLRGRLQERYGIEFEQADKMVKQWNDPASRI